MENLIIEGTEKTPFITCDAGIGKIVISGISIPNVATPIYEPVFDWITLYARSPQPLTRIIFNFVHFDSDSSKCVFDLMRLIQEELHNKGNRVEMEWHYEDEDVMELGEDYMSLLNYPVKLVEEYLE
ncbi:MAG: DUF1987 domain-containing protein [bacterium]